MQNLREISIWKEKPNENANRSALECADILELGLGQRAYNGLKRAGCNTVGDVLAIIGEDGEGLKNVRNLGDKSQKEIMEKLSALEETYSTVSTVSCSMSNRKVLLQPNGKTWNRDIASVGLSTRAYDKLNHAGIIKVGDVYTPFLKQDPGWAAVRELFEKIIGEAI